MTSRNYPRLSVEDFGAQLLVTGDLDPVYIALDDMEWDEAQRNRWLLAYWLCYHCGVACWMSELEGLAFWAALTKAAQNTQPAPTGERWPRSPERRHWRGVAATASVEHLMSRYRWPQDMVSFVSEPRGDAPEAALTYPIVAARVKEHVGFGDWIAFKVADMLERVCGVPVVFSLNDIMYSSPEEAAVHVWLEKQGLLSNCFPKDRRRAVRDVVDHLIEHFRERAAAPPSYDRLVGYQEVETILCKWQSHVHGHYELGHDITEIRAGLQPWLPHSQTARQFLHHFPSLHEEAGVEPTRTVS